VANAATSGGAQAPGGGAPAPAAGGRQIALAVTPDGRGYWTVTASGHVATYGDARSYGSASGLGAGHVVGIAAGPAGRGYWLVTDRGAVLAFGSARGEGTASPPAGDRVVAIAATPDAGGYWIVSADGRVWPHGDAAHLSSPAGSVHDVVGIAVAPDGRGYWLASASGGVLTYGSARWHGSALGKHAGAIAGIAATSDGGGYWLTTTSGDVLGFGDARVARASPPAGSSVSAIATMPDGRGYWLLVTPPPAAATGAPTAKPPISGHVTVIGDSVMIDVAPALEKDIPGVDIQAAVSRQWDDGVALAQQLNAAHALGPIVVVDLGTNGPVTPQQFASMMRALAGVSLVVFVTVHLPPSYSWSTSVNATLAAGVAHYHNARLADFNALAVHHPEWFGSDGVHMAIDGPGAQAMAALIRSLV